MVERPQSLRIAVLLMYVGAALALISGIFGLFTVEESVRLALGQSNAPMSGSNYEAAVSLARGAAYAGVIFSIVVATGLWIWMAIANNAGKSWARIVATVFGVIGIIGNLGSMGTAAAGRTLIIGSLIFGILTLIVSIAALVYMWLKPSTEYYKFKSQKISY